VFQGLAFLEVRAAAEMCGWLPLLPALYGTAFCPGQTPCHGRSPSRGHSPCLVGWSSKRVGVQTP